jgi:hypothetical protein
MRKSERIRLLEMQVIRLEYEVESLNKVMAAFISDHMPAGPDLDSGKWYQRRPN